MPDIRASVNAYEKWLRKELGGEIVEADLDRKHEKMRDRPFSFLRATYWRFAETVAKVCPGFADSPTVLAVGDLHVENFGTWRDAEGRLVWGVNDFDEAAEMPYAYDLIRLAASAVLAEAGMRDAEICDHLLKGYRRGLAAPEPYVLDRDEQWLRRRFAAWQDERDRFWDDFNPDHHSAGEMPGVDFVKALEASRPEATIKLAYWRRQAGAGSLGRPRWVGYGDWRGGPFVREAKAMVPSAWTYAVGGRERALRVNDIATGPYRSPDPWYRVTGRILVRRLSPNNRKLDLEAVDAAAKLVDGQMLFAMGREIASIHRGSTDPEPILADLHHRRRGEFAPAVKSAVAHIREEQAEYAEAPAKPGSRDKRRR
jgi:hypothetical protein